MIDCMIDFSMPCIASEDIQRSRLYNSKAICFSTYIVLEAIVYISWIVNAASIQSCLAGVSKYDCPALSLHLNSKPI
jgi:hypothetical protein